MQFCKRDDIYSISQITSGQENMLGLSFTTEDIPIKDIEVIEWWEIAKIKEKDQIIRTSKDEVLKQVLEGLNEVNKFFGTNYHLSKIYYIPSESFSNNVYMALSHKLIRSYHQGRTFDELY